MAFEALEDEGASERGGDRLKGSIIKIKKV